MVFRIWCFVFRKTPRMKLRQNGIVSLLIRLAAFQASGAAYMKLHLKNAEVGMWNAEGWVAALCLFLKIDRIHHFDIRHSLFDIRYSLFQSFFSDQTGHFFVRRQG